MTSTDEWLRIQSVDLDAQGVAHNAEGKVVFVDGALPGEEVRVQVKRSKKQWEQGDLLALRRESALRVRPRCPHFGLHAGACGGCKMQHVDASSQLAIKQRAVEDQLWHLGKVRPDQVLRAIAGPAWGYRFRARLSVRYVVKKGAVLIGFHERKSGYVADMQSCAVLPPAVSGLLLPLRALIAAMDERDRLPQIELAIGDQDGFRVIALVLRHLELLGDADRERLRAFAATHGVQWWLQPKGPDTAHRLDTVGPELAYSLPEFGVVMPFKPTDFTQVNHQINTVLVGRALRLLDVGAEERVIDWFCGLGNFTLPLASRAREVLGVEGSKSLIERARANAGLNRLSDKTRFEVANLFEIDAPTLVGLGAAQKWLIDPPREGALALVRALIDAGSAEPQGDWRPPQRIVYVSCNPATLARDAGLLVHEAGYRCSAAGAVNMFPHTAHVESIAVFERA